MVTRRWVTMWPFGAHGHATARGHAARPHGNTYGLTSLKTVRMTKAVALAFSSFVG